MGKIDDNFGKFVDYTRKILEENWKIIKSNQKVITSNQKRISNVDETVNKYRNRDIEAEKPSFGDKSLKALRSVLDEEQLKSILKEETIDVLKIIKPFWGEVAHAANKVLAPDVIEIPQTIVNALMKIDNAFKEPIPIKTPIDGLEFYSIEKWEEFYRDIKIAREKDLANLSSTKYQERLIEHAQFDAIMKVEYERYEKLSEIREKEFKGMELRYTDPNFWLEMVTATNESPNERLIRFNKAKQGVNVGADLKRTWIKDKNSQAYAELFNYEASGKDVVVYPNSKKKSSRPVIPIHDINNPIQLAPVQIEADNLAPKLQDVLQAEADKAQTNMMQRLESASSRISSLLGIPQSQAGAVDLEANQNLEMEKLKGLQALGMTELYEAKKLEINKKYNNLQLEAARKGDEEAKSKLPELEAQQQKLAAQKSPIKSIKGMLDKALFDSVASGFEKMGDSAEEAESKTIGVFSAISTNAGKVADFTKGFKSIFGGMDEGLDMVIDSVTNVAQAFATGGPVNGGIALLSEGIKLFGAASAAEKRHQKALKKIHEVTLAQEHAYQLAIRLKSLKYGEGDTIFGTDPYGKAINAAKEYKKNVDILKDSLKGNGIVNISNDPLYGKLINNLYNKKSDTAALENIQIVTGHKKTGFLGMGKGKDTYSGVLSVYKDLIDSEGKLNIERAKSVLANEKMSESDKAAFQRMIDNAQAVEEAYGEMKNYLTSIFGQLGNEMTNALVNSFQKGEDAADAFYKSASKMTQQLVKDVINSAVIAPIMQKAQKEAMEIMQDTSLTDEQRMDKLIAVTDSVVKEGIAASDKAKILYDSANQSFENRTGKNFETTDADKFTQSSSKGGFETMSQDQAGELNGRFTGLQMSGAAVEEYSNIIAANTGELLNETIQISMMVENYLNSFNELRSIQLGSFYELKDINKNTKELYAIREGIDGIKQNTSRL